MKGMTTTVSLMLLVVAGCASLTRQAFEEPVVTFEDVQVRGVGLEGGSLDIVLSVYNPNRFRLDATSMTYQLYVDTIPVGSGRTASQFTVSDRDSMQVRLPLDFRWSGIGAAGRELMRTGTVNYRVVGALDVATGVGTVSVPYDRVGRFSAFTTAPR
jgi:LEA14-like dessication related protein